MSKFPTSPLERLAHTVMAGEVVFFVGAGFSIDSEGNTSERWIARLLARFVAMAEFLIKGKFRLRVADADKGGEVTTRLHKLASELVDALQKEFDLEFGPDPASPATKASTLIRQRNVTKLAKEYYSTNDWMCSAYCALLAELLQLDKHASVSKRIGRRENEFLQDLRGKDKEGKPVETVGLQPINLEALRVLDFRSCGKSLFLDTMGFDDERVMAGQPDREDLGEVAASYEERLLPRHHVLAWLAREGLCPTLVTTNYDLLLEGAFRLAGFKGRGVKVDLLEQLPNVTYGRFCPITDATQFFRHGEASRTAVITKIHGCAATYREAKRRQLEEIGNGRSCGSKTQAHTAAVSNGWQSYLPAIVFTFREIQNWREDSWSRDYLTTLLRTRTLVLLGYSGMDPVLHDTFRTVYEEMARRQEFGVDESALGRERTRDRSELAPAFFFGLADQMEFHGMEILRAASNAVGEKAAPLHWHPNYVRSYQNSDPHFPHVDEVLLWLFHLVFRLRQRQAVESDLRRVAQQLLGHPCATAELDEVLRNFDRLRKEERRLAGSWDDQVSSRYTFQRAVDWTCRFQARLLREWALGETAVRHAGPGLALERLRLYPWYFPMLDRPDWTAWGAVVEVALRRMVACWQGRIDRWQEDSRWFQLLPGCSPAVCFSQGEQAPTPIYLGIGLTSGHRRGLAEEALGVYRRRWRWEFQPECLPWPNTAVGGTPPAAAIWEWASHPIEKISSDYLQPHQYWGERHE
jgi:hypothetical protein